MARSFSSAVLAVVLVVGLVVGGIAGYYGSSSSSAVTSFRTSTTTVAQGGSTVTTTVTGSSQSNSGVDLQAALLATSNASLSAPEWNFAKGSLVVWIENTGNSAIVLAPTMFNYNGSYVNSTHFVIIDPKVVQFGTYAYIPPGSSVIVELIADTALTGYNSTLSVLNYAFTFTYGTSKD